MNKVFFLILKWTSSERYMHSPKPWINQALPSADASIMEHITEKVLCTSQAQLLLLLVKALLLFRELMAKVNTLSMFL